MTHTDRSVPETKGVDVASASVRPEPSRVETAALEFVAKTAEDVHAAIRNAIRLCQISASEVLDESLDRQKLRLAIFNALELPTINAGQAAITARSLAHTLEANDRELSEAREEIERLRGDRDALRRDLWEAKYALAKVREAGKELYKWTLVIESAMHHDAPRDHPKVVAAIKQLFTALENGKANLADANSIESLTLSRDEALEALRPFARMAAALTDSEPDDRGLFRICDEVLTVGDFRRARSVGDRG